MMLLLRELSSSRAELKLGHTSMARCQTVDRYLADGSNRHACYWSHAAATMPSADCMPRQRALPRIPPAHPPHGPAAAGRWGLKWCKNQYEQHRSGKGRRLPPRQLIHRAALQQRGRGFNAPGMFCKQRVSRKASQPASSSIAQPCTVASGASDSGRSGSRQFLRRY